MIIGEDTFSVNSTDLEIDADTALGAVLDTVVRKASLLDLTDFYVGAEADYTENRLAVFFFEGAKEEKLKELKESIDIENFSVTLEATSDNGAAWILRLTQVSEGAASAGVAGDVSVEVPLSGEIDVVSKSAESEGRS